MTRKPHKGDRRDIEFSKMETLTIHGEPGIENGSNINQSHICICLRIHVDSYWFQSFIQPGDGSCLMTLIILVETVCSFCLILIRRISLIQFMKQKIILFILFFFKDISRVLLKHLFIFSFTNKYFQNYIQWV